MKHLIASRPLSDVPILFEHLPMLYQPYLFYDGLVFHTRKSVSHPSKALLYLENDLGLHFLGYVPSNAEDICFEILEFLTEMKKGF